MKRWIGLAAAVVVAAGIVGLLWWLTRPQKQTPAPPEKTIDHSAFTQILKENVHNGGVDYANIKAHRRDALENYLQMLQAVDVDSLKHDERLAYWINRFNAIVICDIAERYHPGYSVADDDFALLKKPRLEVDGDPISLTELENRVIRGWFKENRVHGALVWGAKSSPPMRAEAFVGKNLGKQLDEQMSRFVNDPARNRVDVKARTMHVSKLFEWYADDFGGARRIADYLNKFSKVNLAGFKLQEMDWDWGLNDARGAATRPVQKDEPGE